MIRVGSMTVGLAFGVTERETWMVRDQFIFHDNKRDQWPSESKWFSKFISLIQCFHPVNFDAEFVGSSSVSSGKPFQSVCWIWVGSMAGGAGGLLVGSLSSMLLLWTNLMIFFSIFFTYCLFLEWYISSLKKKKNHLAISHVVGEGVKKQQQLWFLLPRGRPTFKRLPLINKIKWPLTIGTTTN